MAADAGPRAAAESARGLSQCSERPVSVQRASYRAPRWTIGARARRGHGGPRRAAPREVRPRTRRLNSQSAAGNRNRRRPSRDPSLLGRRRGVGRSRRRRAIRPGPRLGSPLRQSQGEPVRDCSVLCNCGTAIVALRLRFYCCAAIARLKHCDCAHCGAAIAIAFADAFADCGDCRASPSAVAAVAHRHCGDCAAIAA
jgi:hypothetical protein